MEQAVFQGLTGYPIDWQTLRQEFLPCTLLEKLTLQNIIISVMLLTATLDWVLTTARCTHITSFDSHSKPEGLTVACPLKRRTIKPSRVEQLAQDSRQRVRQVDIIIFLCAWVNRTDHPKAFQKLMTVSPKLPIYPSPLPSLCQL